MTPAPRQAGPGAPEGVRVDAQRRAAPDDAVHNALRTAVEVETERYLWVPEDAIRFTPPLASTIFGDGRALFRFTTINDRPAYWVVRGDSRLSCNDGGAYGGTVEMHDIIDDVLSALEDEFGSGRWDEDDDGNEVEGEPFPSIDDELGCSWCRMSWPALEGVETERHPYDPWVTILAAPAGADAEATR